LCFITNLRLSWFFLMSYTLRFIEMSLQSSAWLFTCLSTKISSEEEGSTLDLWIRRLEWSLAMTLRLLFFLIALNFSVPVDCLSLLRQYFLNYLLLLVELVC
jgi:hypothetical protein